MWPDTTEDLESFIAEFENGTWPHCRWDHQAHITMAAYYLCSMPIAKAVARIKCGIREYNARQGTKNSDSAGYHETLTAFWIAILIPLCLQEDFQDTLCAKVRTIASMMANDRDLWRCYYSTNILKDTAARRSWRDPDIKHLPCPAAPVNVVPR